MKYIKFLGLIAIFTLIANQQCSAMQSSSQINQETLNVTDFDMNRDLESVTNIFKSDWERLYVGRPFNPELVKTLLAPYKAEDQIKMVKVLRKDNKTVGFVSYYFFPQRNPKEGYLELGGLASEIRRQGLAKHYFPQILSELEGMGSEILTVFVKKDNTAARNLYEKFGFKIIDEHAIKDTSFKLAKEIKTVSQKDN